MVPGMPKMSTKQVSAYGATPSEKSENIFCPEKGNPKRPADHSFLACPRRAQLQINWLCFQRDDFHT
jgi:hypothetical protein